MNETRSKDTRYILSFNDNEQLMIVVQNMHNTMFALKPIVVCSPKLSNRAIFCKYIYSDKLAYLQVTYFTCVALRGKKFLDALPEKHGHLILWNRCYHFVNLLEANTH